MGSTRLPGKVLLDIVGEQMLARVVEQTEAVQGLDAVVVATTESSHDDPIAELAGQRGWRIFRGSESDVLDRYVQAARQADASHVLRVTADCPLLWVEGAGAVLSRHLETGADYTHNLSVWGSGLPVGVGTEVFTRDTLERSWREGTAPHHREHVDEYVYENPESFRIERVDIPEALSRPSLRLTVDTREDLELIRQIYQRVSPRGGVIDLRDVIELTDREPGLRAINEHVVQKRI
jgi:spore coat polysaccharide biosynthesis protein SpsF